MVEAFKEKGPLSSCRFNSFDNNIVVVIIFQSLSHFWLSATPWTVAHQAPWYSPGKNDGVGCHVFLQGILPTQGSNPGLLHWQEVSLPLVSPGSLLKCPIFVVPDLYRVPWRGKGKRLLTLCCTVLSGSKADLLVPRVSKPLLGRQGAASSLSCGIIVPQSGIKPGPGSESPKS